MREVEGGMKCDNCGGVFADREVYNRHCCEDVENRTTVEEQAKRIAELEAIICRLADIGCRNAGDFIEAMRDETTKQIVLDKVYRERKAQAEREAALPTIAEIHGIANRSAS